MCMTVVKKLKEHSHFKSYEFEFEKSFHVSPFMPMDIHYKWRFNFSDEQNVIHMQLYQSDKFIFDATMCFHFNQHHSSFTTESLYYLSYF